MVAVQARKSIGGDGLIKPRFVPHAGRLPAHRGSALNMATALVSSLHPLCAWLFSSWLLSPVPAAESKVEYSRFT